MQVRERMQDILSQLKVRLSDEQAQVFWADSPVVILSAGEGSGKSYLGALFGIALSQARGDNLVWLVGRDFEDARMEMGFLLGWNDPPEVQFAYDLGIVDREASSLSAVHDQPVTLKTTTGTTFKTISGYDPEKIGREQPDIIVGCEVSRWEVELYRRCIGRLARKHGYARGFFAGSPKSEFGWFPETFRLGQGPNEQGVRSFSLPSWANPILFPGGENDPAIEMLRQAETPERFAARYLGMPTQVRDAVLPEFKTTLHVYPVKYQEGSPVYAFIDPSGGNSGSVYAILFVQIVGSEVHVLNEVYMNQVSHEQVLQECMMRPEWKYTKEGVIDLAGTQHHAGLGSAEEAWRRDTGLRLRSSYHQVGDVVERLRSVLAINTVTGRPRLLIHPQCTGLIAEMGGGPAPIRGVGIWRMQGDRPRNSNCDAVKALGYGLLAYYGTARPQEDDDEEWEAVSYLPQARSNDADRWRRLMHPENANPVRTGGTRYV